MCCNNWIHIYIYTHSPSLWPPQAAAQPSVRAHWTRPPPPTTTMSPTSSAAVHIKHAGFHFDFHAACDIFFSFTLGLVMDWFLYYYCLSDFCVVVCRVYMLRGLKYDEVWSNKISHKCLSICRWTCNVILAETLHIYRKRFLVFPWVSCLTDRVDFEGLLQKIVCFNCIFINKVQVRMHI